MREVKFEEWEWEEELEVLTLDKVGFGKDQHPHLLFFDSM